MTDWDQLTCACPACCAARGEGAADADIAAQTALAGSYSIDTATDDADQAIDALLGGVAWATTDLTFSFPDSASDFSYNWYGEQNGFGAFNAAQKAAARAALDMYQDVSGLVFTELTGASDRDADLTFAESASAGTAYAYFPSSGDWGGDAWFNTTSYNAPEAGNYAWATILHEIGHGLGLKHGHDTAGTGAIPTAYDSHEYSLMTYRSYVGSPGSYYSNETWGGPQTPMMLDIAAVQRLYGANYDHNAGDTTYAFDPTTGQMMVDGVGGATPGGNRILRTIWDGGGTDTYDFAAYATDLAVDLSPGGYVDLDVGGFAQRARLGYDAYAKGHIFNALLFNGDQASLIENAIGGDGDDLLFGNDGGNLLDGGAGDDQLVGGVGDDELIGGEGADIAIFDGLFETFQITAADGALDVLGEGSDRVLASVETLRFTDVDVAFASLAAPASPVDPTAGAGDVVTGDPDPTTPTDPVSADQTTGQDDGGTTTDTSGDKPAEDPLIEDPVGEDPVGDDPVTADPTPEDPDTPVADDPSDPGLLVDDDGDGDSPLSEPTGQHLVGGAGADALFGADGADTLSGGGGADTLRGNQGADQVDGNRGGDRLAGGAAADTVDGGGGADWLHGGAGDDRLVGGGGRDTLIGGGGDDNGFGGGGADRLAGRGGADTLDGGGGSDTIRGDAGSDQIIGGRGADVLTGGDGRDMFVFDDRFGVDRITDFHSGDTLDFSRHSFVNSLADLSIRAEGTATIVEDGDGARIILADLAPAALTEGDFLF